MPNSEIDIKQLDDRFRGHKVIIVDNESIQATASGICTAFSCNARGIYIELDSLFRFYFTPDTITDISAEGYIPNYINRRRKATICQ